MNSRELAENVATIVAEAQERILGIGAEQYAEGDQQKFERMDIDALLVYTEEELLDQINYSVMNLIRIRKVRAALDHARKVIRDAVAPSYDDAHIRKLAEAFMGEPKASSPAKD